MIGLNLNQIARAINSCMGGIGTFLSLLSELAAF